MRCHQKIRRCGLVLSILVLVLLLPTRPACAQDFQRGDANADGTVDVADPLFTLFHLFVGGAAAPTCLDAADADDSSVVDLSDAVYSLGYLFLGGSRPPDPGPRICGPDPTGDGLDCQSFPPCPTPTNEAPQALFAVAPAGPLEIVFDASASSDPDGSISLYEWTFGDGASGSGVRVVHTYAVAASYEVSLTVTDDDGAPATQRRTIQVLEPSLPPDPATVAPPLDSTEWTTLYSATEFLYTGPDAIQTGVAPETIDPRLVSVIRGRVVERDGLAVSGVEITIPGRPEYGRTASRADGKYDLVVNGLDLLTVRFEKPGFLTAQRQLDVPERDHVQVDDVALIPLDPQVTTVDLDAADGIQVARASVVADEDGARQSTLLFPPTTTATLRMPDGSTQALETLDVRATEYTVGSSGPQAMPGELPPTSAYTYALEFSVDEALEAGAVEVEFSEPLVHYVENFLGFPAGTAVPLAYYDRDTARWIPSRDGVVLDILDVIDGLAVLDTDGDAFADLPQTLEALGISTEELQELGSLYEVGQSLWRVRIPHFSPWDCNWPYSPPQDATPPQRKKPRKKRKDDEWTIECRSIIEVQNQILGQAIPIAGTPYGLHYRSDRVRGRGEDYTLEIELTGDSLPFDLLRVDLVVHVSGWTYLRSFDPQPGLTETFRWDGLDIYGRQVQGEQDVHVRIGYVYPAVYQEPADFEESFALFSGVPLTGNSARGEITIWQEFFDVLGTLVPTSFGEGGWTLDVHHAYSLDEFVLYKGNGQRRRAATLNLVIEAATVDGIFDDRPAEEFAPDGTLYFPDDETHTVYRVKRDLSFTAIAGTGNAGFSGDGGPAVAAELDTPFEVSVAPDGSFYILDTGNARIRYVDSERVIHTLAGNGELGPGGDGQLASEVPIGESFPTAMSLAADGSLYYSAGAVIRRVGTNGIVTTVAGAGTATYNGDGIPATEAGLVPEGFDLAADGSLYVADSLNHRVRRIGTDGIITTVAGSGQPPRDPGLIGDGGAATAPAARLYEPLSVAVARDGSLYIADFLNARVRRVSTDGIITTVAGTGRLDRSGDGGPATRADVVPAELAIGADDTLYVAEDFQEEFPGGIRRIGAQLPGFLADELVIPSEDGSEIYVFDFEGRHLRTLGGLTGTVRRTFDYNEAGLLVGVTDADGDVTVIERDAFQRPVAIVAPHGQRTELSLGAGGYVGEITSPPDRSFQFEYTPDGLMTRYTDPGGQVSEFEYDDGGMLTRDSSAACCSLDLARQELPDGFQVTTTAAGGETSIYRVENRSEGGKRRLRTFPDGTSTETIEETDGTRTMTSSSGTVTVLRRGPDPRFGMHTLLDTEKIITTPAGRIHHTTRDRESQLLNPDDPFSLIFLGDILSINGRTYTNMYDTDLGEILTTSPEGRQRWILIDEQGRVIEKQFGELESTVFTYDGNGRLASMARGEGPQLRQMTLTYGADGHVETMSAPPDLAVSFERDAAGRVTRQLMSGGRAIAYTYDANGNFTSMTPPGKPAHTFEYDAAGSLTVYTAPDPGDGSRRTTVLSHGPDRRLSLIDRPDGKTVAFDYDGAGRLASRTVARGAVTYTYSDETGHLAAVSTPEGEVLTVTYDGILLTSSSLSGPVSGTVAREYDENFLVTSRSVNGDAVAHVYDDDALLSQAGSLQIQRDPLTGLITGTTLGGLTDQVEYNGFGEVIGYQATLDGAAVFAYTLERDPLGRIGEKVETVGAGSSSSTVYGYDAAGRLAGVTVDGVTTASYDYDLNGNRILHTASGVSTPFTCDVQDRLLEYGSVTFTYSAAGDLETRTDSDGGTTTTYQYDALGNLLSVALSDGRRIDYVVDGINRRVGKKVDDVLVQGFLYKDAWNPIAELDGDNQVVSRFVYGSRRHVPDYMITSAGTFRIVSDHLGSPRVVIDIATGSVAQRLEYDEFGNITLDTQPGFQPFAFAGGLHDPDTGLVRFGARDYDPRIGRWTAKDPLLFAARSTNFYSYAANDPVNRVDLDGRQYGEADIDKSWNGPSDFMEEPAPGSHERIDMGNGNYEERGRTADGIDYVRACEAGTCSETIWDNETQTSGEAMYDFNCEGADCPDPSEMNKLAMEKLTDVDSGEVGPPQEPPAEAAPPGGGGRECSTNVIRDSAGNVVAVVPVP